MASIKDLGNGKYRIFISNKFNEETGKRNMVTKVITAKSFNDAEKQAILLEDKVHKSRVEANNCTFNELVDKWRKYRDTKKKKAEKTIVRYEGILNSFMLKFFGKKKVKDITALDIERYLASLDKDGVRLDGKKGGYSQKTKRHHYMLLSSILKKAVKWKMIDENPCKDVDPPEVEEKEAKHYEPEQVAQLLEHLKNAEMKYKVFVHVALFTGFRRSEIMGLEWKDIDLDNNIIKLCRTSQYTAEKGIFTVSKLKNGKPSRIITIPEGTTKLLKLYKEFQDNQKNRAGDNWEEHDRLFTQDNGKPMHPDTPYQWFTDFLKEKNLPKITVHQLRHTHISMLIYNGMDIVAVSKRAGHQKVSTTLDIYGHIITKADYEGANRLEKMFYAESNV